MNLPHPVWHSRLHVLITIALLYLGAYSIAAASWPRPGFLVAYTTSRLLLEGADPIRFYDNDWFSQQAQRFEPTVYDINVNPPTLALLTLPLAWLPYRTARLLWGMINLVLLGLFLWGLGREMRWYPTTMTWVILGVLVFQPVYANQEQGQLYLLLAVLTLWGWIGYRRHNEFWLGVALAGMLLLKLGGLFIWPLLLVQKRWRVLLWGGGLSLVIGLLTLPWLTWASWLAHFRFILVSPSAPERAVTAYQSINSLIRHLFTYDPVYSPEPLFVSPTLAQWLPMIILLALLAVTLWVGAKAKGTDGPFMAVVVLGVIASPLALDYHYVLVLLPLGVMGLVERPHLPRFFPFIFLSIYLLLSLPLPYTAPRLAYGWLAFLAYPKLYGGLLLWGICLYLSRRNEKELVGTSSRHPCFSIRVSFIRCYFSEETLPMPVDSFRFLPRLITTFYQSIEREPELPIPWTPVTRPQHETIFGLVTSAGLYHAPSQSPFDLEREKAEPTWGDPSFRAIPTDAPLAELATAHLHINPADLLTDINIQLPLTRFRELADEGVVGGVARAGYSLMGYQGFPPDAAAWQHEVGPQIAGLLKAEGVTAVLLTPA